MEDKILRMIDDNYESNSTFLKKYFGRKTSKLMDMNHMSIDEINDLANSIKSII